MELYFLLFLLGIIGGFLAGLIGIGGGVMYVLILPYLLLQMGFPESEIVQFTIANSLVGTMFASLSANIVLIKQKNFYLKQVIVIGLFASVAAVVLLDLVVNTSLYDRDKFNLAVIVLMLFIIYRTIKQNWSKDELNHELKLKFSAAVGVGLGAGSVAALSGLGGGTIIIPVLNTGFKMNMIKAKSISLGVILISSFVATVFNWLESPSSGYIHQSHGYIVYPLALIISLGVMVGSPFGVKTASKMSNQWISAIFILFVGVVIIDKLLQLVEWH